MNGYEIERKYLIAYPNLVRLTELGVVKEIEQTYLASEKGVTRRIRKSVCQGVTSLVYCEKTDVTDIIRTEKERTLTAAEYEDLLKEAITPTLTKTRYVFGENGYVYEVDVYPFWSDRAILEIETEEVEYDLPIPPCLTVLKEVTSDKAYSNRRLAEFLSK